MAYTDGEMDSSGIMPTYESPEERRDRVTEELISRLEPTVGRPFAVIMSSLLVAVAVVRAESPKSSTPRMKIGKNHERTHFPGETDRHFTDETDVIADKIGKQTEKTLAQIEF